MIDENEILRQFDHRAKLFFPSLDSPKEFLAAARMTAYGDGLTWAATIELLVFATRATGDNRIRVWIYVYGDAIVGKPGAVSEDLIHPVSQVPGRPVFASEMDDEVLPGSHVVRVRDRLVDFQCTAASLAAAGVVPVFPPRITGPDVLRLLAPQHRGLMLATDPERRRRLPKGIPQLLQTDEWHHPDVRHGEKPSETRCFRSLAQALASGDTSAFQTEQPNTDWRNWPAGGML